MISPETKIENLLELRDALVASGPGSFLYLATPYSYFNAGCLDRDAALDEAAEFACQETGYMAFRRIPVFCPIANSHYVAKAAGLDPRDHEIWIPVDFPFLHLAAAFLAVLGSGWRLSKGMRMEAEYARGRGILLLEKDPGQHSPLRPLTADSQIVL